MTRSAVASRQRTSYEGYRSSVDSHTHSEWVNGEATIFRPQTTLHAQLLVFLATLVGVFVAHRDLGRVFILRLAMKLLDGRSYRQPDLLFIAEGHRSRIGAERIDGPANLVVEIVSEGTVRRDRRDKYHEYSQAGVTEYWIVEGRDGRSGFDLFILDVDRRYVRQLPTPDGRLESRILPGFWLDPDWLAADPLPDVVDCLLAIAPDFLSGRS